MYRLPKYLDIIVIPIKSINIYRQEKVNSTRRVGRGQKRFNTNLMVTKQAPKHKGVDQSFTLVAPPV